MSNNEEGLEEPVADDGDASETENTTAESPIETDEEQMTETGAGPGPEAADRDQTRTDAETPETQASEQEAAVEEAAVLDEDVMPDDEADLLIPVDDYLAAGVHIGTQQKTESMERFIHRVRTDGLYVLDVSQTDQRIRTAARFIADYEPDLVLVASSRQYGRFPAERFAQAVGARARTGRFIPGTLTNPEYEGYIEPDVVVVTDPIGDAQAVKEAITVGIPVVAMCDSNNTTSNVDLVVPTNNKGRRALSVVYWLLANEVVDNRGGEPSYALEDFEEGI